MGPDRERRQLPSERRMRVPPAGYAAVEHIENASTENEPDGGVKKRRRFIRTGPLNERALYDLKRGRESAEKVTRRHQIRQEVNLRTFVAHRRYSSCAMMDAPP